jgi:CubicO group peptidase (beta-lactamase class C family)
MIRKRLAPIIGLSVFLALVMAVNGTALAQQPAAPDFKDSTVMPGGPIGERIKSAIEALSSGDAARFKRFLNEDCDKSFREQVPFENYMAMVRMYHGETGGIDFYGVRSYTPERKGQTVVIVKDRVLGGWRGLNFRFGGAPAYLIAGLNFSAARPPLLSPEPPLTEKEAVVLIAALADRLIKTGWYSGTLLVAKGPGVLLTAAGGEADKSFHVPNTIDTKFNLGSMNKMFTSTAIARLVEARRLSFDDPIGKYIDESWLPKDVTAKITVRHLITHTSGLGSYFNETYMKSSRDLFRMLGDYKPLIKDDRPAFPPGERFQYSNTGMFLLGVIIEKVTGEDYFDHIRKAIYGPAGMTGSDCYEMDRPVENLAIGYSPDPDSPYKWQNNLYKHVLKGGPAGGGFSTVKDLHKFALALLSGKFVSQAMRDTMWTDFKGGHYGFGFEVSQGPKGKTVGHSGGFPGINSQLDIHVDSGYIVAAMCNYDNGASPLAQKIAEILARVRAN